MKHWSERASDPSYHLTLV